MTSHPGIFPRSQNSGRLELSGYRNSWRCCFDDDTFGTKDCPGLLGFVSGQPLKRGVELQAGQALQAHATNKTSEGRYDISLASLAAYLSSISVAVCGGQFTGTSNIVHQHQRLRCLMSFLGTNNQKLVTSRRLQGAMSLDFSTQVRTASSCCKERDP